MKRFRLVICILMLLGLSVCSTMVYAEETSQSKHVLTFSDLGFPFDREASGIVDELTYDFLIPPTWEGAQPTINLHFSHSSSLLPELSGMSVYYNEVPLSHIQLTAENEKDGWLEIEVPATVFKAGRQSLKIVFSQHLTREECEDNSTTLGLWTIIHQDSTITFENVPSPTFDLARFPEPFSIWGQHAFRPVDLTVSLPAQPDEAELQAAGLALAKLGQLVGAVNLSVTLGDVPAEGHVFLIARTDSVSDLLTSNKNNNLPLSLLKEGFVSPDSRLVSDDEGVIQLVERADGSALLLLSGESELALSRAGLALANRHSLNLMSGSFTVVRETPQQIYPPMPQTGLMTLQDVTGKAFERVQGTNSQPLELCFEIPPHWMLEPSAKLALNYSYAPTLLPDRSSLAVRLNNKTLTTVKLDGSEPGARQLELPLPTKELLNGTNCLSFIFTLRLSESQCAVELAGDAWAEIDGDSSIFLPHTDREASNWQPDIAQYPYPFNLEQDLANITLLLPDSLTRSEIEGALKLAARFGQDARHETLLLQVKSANAWNEDSDRQDHLILIGDASRNVVSKQLQDALTSDDQAPDQDVVQQQLRNASLAVASLLASPWAADRGILHIYAHHEAALEELFDLLSANHIEQQGNIVTVAKGGMVRTIDTFNRLARTTQIMGIEEHAPVVDDQKNDHSATNYAFLIAVAIILSEIILISIRIIRRHRQPQPQLASEATSSAPFSKKHAFYSRNKQSTLPDEPPSIINRVRASWQRKRQSLFGKNAEGSASSPCPANSTCEDIMHLDKPLSIIQRARQLIRRQPKSAESTFESRSCARSGARSLHQRATNSTCKDIILLDDPPSMVQRARQLMRRQPKPAESTSQTRFLHQRATNSTCKDIILLDD
ncbi:MAG: cellulose biosynthesis cyclic di-GMP-binding regulatory protein BcsB, partial [Ardenticatenaceae bacterium]